MFQRLYADNPRVEFIVNAVPFYAFPWGANLLGFHHGHKVKFDKLPGLFMDEYRHLLGGTERTYIHKEIKEVGKTVVEMHRTLAARDAHSSYGGYPREHGEWSRLTVRPAPVIKSS